MAKNISDLDKSLLTTSDYTNNTDVSIDTDYSAKIGALDNLKTSNKGSLVAAINELFQSGTNAKQQLVDALVAKGVSCSTSDSWDTLMNHINEGASGGLDIISATELPATGKENQICIITNNPTDNFIITSDLDETIVDNNITLYTGNRLNGVHTPIINNNVTNNYYFCKVKQNESNLSSYIYKNNSWEQITYQQLILLENGYYKNNDYHGGLVGNNPVVYNEGTGISVSTANFSYNTYVQYWGYATFLNMANLAPFTTMEITAYVTAAKNMTLYLITSKNNPVNGGTSGSTPTDFSIVSSNTINDRNPQTYKFDLTGLNENCYFGFATYQVGDATFVNIVITDILLY